MKSFLIVTLMMFSIESLADNCPPKPEGFAYLLQQSWVSRSPGHMNLVIGDDLIGTWGKGPLHREQYFYCYENGLLTLTDKKEKKIVGVFKIKEIDKEKLVLTIPFKPDVIEYCRVEVCPK